MEQSHRMMKEVYKMKNVTLHVRFSNIAARDLYLKRLKYTDCLLYTSPSPRDLSTSRMPSSA